MKTSQSRPLRLVYQAGEISIFFAQIIQGCFKKINIEGLIAQIIRMGVESVPLILITGVFTGMVLAAQTFEQLHKLSAETLVGPIVGVGMVASLGPILAALMLSSRVGGSMAAELGTMQVTEQIDALRVFGTNPIRYLVVPRFLACILITPLLTLLADVVGVVGGYWISTSVFNIDAYHYIEKTKEYMGQWDIFVGVIKAFFFGMIIATFCCWRGLITRSGAEGVGRATTQANVLSSIGILVSNFILTVFLSSIHNRFLI